MKKLASGIYQSEFEYPFNNEVKTCSYFVKSEHGNLLMYSSKHNAKYFDFMESQGGVKLQLLSHSGDVQANCDLIKSYFKAPAVCHPLELKEAQKTCAVEAGFEQVNTWFDIECIPTPGYKRGSTCYLWDGPEGKVLFSGDTVYASGESLGVAFDPENKSIMIKSLEELATLEARYLASSLFIGYESFIDFGSTEAYQNSIKNCIQSLKRI